MADESTADNTDKTPQINKTMDEIGEKNTKQENEENVSGNNIVNNDLSNQASSNNFLSSPRFKCSSDQNVKKIFSSVLRPSQLNGNVNSSPTTKPLFSLNPSRLNPNPFSKIQSEDNSNHGEQRDNSSVVTSTNKNMPKFLPLLQNGNKPEAPTVKTTATSSATTTSVSSSNFVFGQNLQERIANEDSKLNNFANTNGTPNVLTNPNSTFFRSGETSASCSRNSNGTSDMLFISALQETPILLENNSNSRSQGITKSLSESAREYEESRAVKRKYDEVEVKTGEEGETNVLQIMCKLFAFNKTAGGGWQERGRGILRLNDQNAHGGGNSHSRLVFRTAGSLRVVLNTKIWAEMTIQRASDRSIRLTAFDYNGEIKVFLLTGNPEEIKQLQKHLEIRVKKEMEKTKDQKPTPSRMTPDNLEPVLKRMMEEEAMSNN